MGNDQTTASSKAHTKTFVLSIIDITAPLPFEIIPTHFLDRAKPDEIDTFKDLINKTRIIKSDFFLYEKSQPRAVQGESEAQINYEFDDLPAGQWKYWTVSHDGYNDEISRLQQASLLIKNEIEYGFQFLSQGETAYTSFGGTSLQSFMSDDMLFPGNRNTAQISLDDLQNINTYHALITQLNPEFRHVHSALKLLDDLRGLPRESDFVVVGLFSIIESLISHSPKLDFYHDSIKHQIRTKIPLLRKKFDRNLDYVEYFRDRSSEDKILSKLYDYSSRVVHSGQSQLSDSFSQILIGKKEILNFLFELTKLLLIASLREPVFMTDLKSC